MTLLLMLDVGRMLLKYLVFLRRAILYCKERGVVVASALASWPLQVASHCTVH